MSNLFMLKFMRPHFSNSQAITYSLTVVSFFGMLTAPSQLVDICFQTMKRDSVDHAWSLGLTLNPGISAIVEFYGDAVSKVM